MRIFRRESESGSKEASAVEFAVVGDHEHDFPFEDVVVVDEAAADAGDVLVGLHLCQLASEHAPSCRGSHFVVVCLEVCSR